MISIKQINEKDIDLCYELDSNTISLWSKKQWANEFKKEGTKVFGLLITNLVIGILTEQENSVSLHYYLKNINFLIYFGNPGSLNND